MWAQFIAAGITGWLGNQGKKEMAEIETRLSATNAKASNQVRRAKNMEQAGHNSLARYVQTVNAKRQLDDGGDAFTMSLVNGLRSGDANINRNIVSDIQSMEQFGVAVASQAASGVGGQVTDMINSTTALRASISKELQLQEQETANFEVGQRSKSIMHQMIGGIDASPIVDQFDTQIAYAQRSHAPSNTQAIVSSLINTAVKSGVQNVAAWGSSEVSSWFKAEPAGNGFGPRLTARSSPYALDGSAAKFGFTTRNSTGI
jgi:hypothetical protein